MVDVTSTEQADLQALIEHLSAYIEQMHNGFVRFVSFDGGTLTLEFGGRCEDCGLLSNTLNGWVAGSVRQFFPVVEVVGISASSGERITF